MTTIRKGLVDVAENDRLRDYFRRGRPGAHKGRPYDGQGESRQGGDDEEAVMRVGQTFLSASVNADEVPAQM